ncbi:sensor histidine kinase [Kribbella sp. NPDC050241]|uniref:sensor histidine kinase n=1 Tax=Kribbella sp. NPDC050241 TaxID=3364115 RepID=UPI0037B615C6
MSGWWPPGRRPTRRHLWGDLLVLAGLMVFVGGVYLVVVVLVGRFVGRSHSPSPALSVLATIIVGVGFEPVRRTLRGWANELTHRSAPYEVLAHFTADSQTPARMAQVLGTALNASTVEIWLLAGGRIQLAAAHPADNDAPTVPPDLTDPVPGRHLRAVRHSGDLLGLLVVEERADEPLTPVDIELLDSLTAQAGLVVRNLGLTAALQDRLRDVSARADLLRESRRRVAESEDVERRRLERDLHDGAQQQLVSLAVNLGLARTLVGLRPDQAREHLHTLDVSVEQAVTDLLDVIGGRPRLLAETGLTAALRAAVETSPVPVELVSAGLGRYPTEVEHALYYCCLEALQNAAKHAAAHGVVIELYGDNRAVSACIRDDGKGFATAPDNDGGLTHMAERIHAVGGVFTISSVPRAGTTVRAEVPLAVVSRAP